LRPAHPEDAIEVACVHVRSWQEGYRGLLPDAFLDQLRPEDRAARYDFSHLDPAKPHTIVATDAGAITGFVTTMPSLDEGMQDYGELCALYVDPEWWGHGIGRALAAEARARLSAQGFRQALLWVLNGNERAQRFYRKDRWVPDGAQRIEIKWGVKL